MLRVVGQRENLLLAEELHWKVTASMFLGQLRCLPCAAVPSPHRHRKLGIVPFRPPVLKPFFQIALPLGHLDRDTGIVEHHARLIAARFFFLEVLKRLFQRAVGASRQQLVFSCQPQAQAFQYGGLAATPATNQGVVAGVEMDCQWVFLAQAQFLNCDALDLRMTKLLRVVGAFVTPADGRFRIKQRELQALNGRG